MLYCLKSVMIYEALHCASILVAREPTPLATVSCSPLPFLDIFKQSDWGRPNEKASLAFERGSCRRQATEAHTRYGSCVQVVERNLKLSTLAGKALPTLVFMVGGGARIPSVTQAVERIVR